MSCGKPHETPCEEVLEQVWLYLDGELKDPDLGLIRAHLDECAGCLRKYGLDQVVKALVARSCGGDVAPEHLRAKVVATLHSVSIKTSHVEYRPE